MKHQPYPESELVQLNVNVPYKLKKRLLAKLAYEESCVRVWVLEKLQEDVGEDTAYAMLD